MEDSKTTTLDFDLRTPVPPTPRRKLLPWWIKTFAWIFMIAGVVVPVGLVFGLLGYSFQMSLYGIQTTDPISVIGLSLSALFMLKAVASFGLWFEKDWAIVVAKTDAILGICICVFVMMIWPYIDDVEGFSPTFRLELLFIIPYLLKINSIGRVWA